MIGTSMPGIFVWKSKLQIQMMGVMPAQQATILESGYF
jgi:hypothetical protein